jgi:hypothetical protein
VYQEVYQGEFLGEYLVGSRKHYEEECRVAFEADFGVVYQVETGLE